MERERTVDRRTFLRTMAGAAGAVPLLAAAKAQAQAPGYRRLGRTDLSVSMVSFGGHAAYRGYLVSDAIERGVNLIHTSPFYGRGMGMRTFGQVMTRWRHKVVLAVKSFPDARTVDRCLQVLRTDHIDLLMPGIQSLSQLRRDDYIEQFQKRKQEGKVRFLGMACHSSVARVAAAALEKDCFDVIMIVYNLSNRNEEGIQQVLAEAKRRDVGVIAMKSMRGLAGPGGGEPSIDLQTDTLRDLLTEPGIATVLRRMGSTEDVVGYTRILQSKEGRAHPGVRQREEAIRRTVCSMCGACDVCPQGVRVSDILRYAAYAADVDPVHRAHGPDAYRRLAKRRSALACTGCAKCEQACPKGLPIRRLLAQAHRTLTGPRG